MVNFTIDRKRNRAKTPFVSIELSIEGTSTVTPFCLLQSDRTTIHKNLCVCLLIAEILFVCGIGQTNQRIVCGIVAGLLHFFFLCAFAWMFLEGISRRQYNTRDTLSYRIVD